MYFTKIDWAPSETLFKIGSFGIHYYSLMFIIAFGLGYYIMKKIFIEEKISLDYLESLFVYIWANRWNRFEDYYGNNFNQRNKRDYRSTVARIKSGRGEKTYNSPKERNKEKNQNSDLKTLVLKKIQLKKLILNQIR